MNNKEINILLQALKEGTIAREDQRRLELAALDDPFLFDALEGYTLHRPAQNEGSELLARINKHINEGKKRPVIFWLPLVAALFVGILGFIFLFDQGASEVHSKIPVLAEKANDASETDSGYGQKEIAVIKQGESDSEPIPSSITLTRNDQVSDDKKTSKRKKQTQESLNRKVTSSVPVKTEIVNADLTNAIESSDDPTEVVISEVLEDAENTTAIQNLDSTIAASSELISTDEVAAFESANALKKAKSSKSDLGNNTRIIKGVVLDNDGVPLIGANVLYGQNGTITDFDGAFSISQDSLIDILEIDYIGYESKIIDLINEDSSSPLIIMLNEGRMLDEVVVTGKTKRLEDWSEFDKRVRNAARQDLLMYGIQGEYEVELKFRYSMFGKIKNVEIVNSTHPLLNDKVKEWIKQAKDQIPGRKGRTIERTIRIWK